MTDAIDTPLFQTILRPHRSLQLGGFRLVMALVAGASAIASLPFVLLGFWPVAGFYGLDLLLLYFAFKSNFKAAQHFEEVRISPFELLLRKVSPEGHAREWRFNPAWTRLVAEEHEEFGITRLALVSRGQSIAVGHFLGADDKATLLKGLSRALGEAKRGPFYS
jgi:uncharacterized membrane protein